MSQKIGLDQLLTMPQEELESRFSTIDGYIKREWRKGRRHVDLEVEACYFARELTWRDQVRANHEKYLQKLQQDYSLE